jgi:hypothetical protein
MRSEGFSHCARLQGLKPDFFRDFTARLEAVP